MIDLQSISKQSGIYKITNIINNKVYIGQAKNLKIRVKGHFDSMIYDIKLKFYFQKAIKKYGIENFELEILVQGKFTKPELDELEIDFIRLHNSNNQKFGYNMTDGGGGTVGYKHNNESKEKMSKVHKGKIISEEHKRKLKEFNLGKKYSQEYKDKMSKIKKGRITSEETKEKLSNVHKGKKMSNEAKEKMRKNNLGKKLSEITKQKIKNGNLGKKYSEETKQKMRKPKSKEHIENRVKSRMLNKARKQMQENCCYEEYFYNDFVYQS